MLGKIIVLGLVVCRCAIGASVCSVMCEDGEYCFQTECRPCPEGSYLEVPVHQKTSCTPWTTKPSDSNFVIARNGSSTSDVLWKCQDGYVQYDAEKCISITTLSHNNMTTITTSRGFFTVVTTTTVASNISERNENKFKLTVIFVIIGILLVVIIIVGTIFRRQFKVWFSKKIKNVSGVLPREECVPMNIASDQNALLSGASNKLPKDINFRFFLQIIQKITIFEAEEFLKVLDDPSGTFQADNVLSFQNAKYSDRQTSLTSACMVWATRNLNMVDHKECVSKALTHIGRPDILNQLQETQLAQDDFACVHLCGESNSVKGSFKTSVKSKCFYFLVDKLGPDDSQTLMYRLPNTDKLFNAKNFFAQKIYFERKSFQLSFVDTLVEWHIRNPDCVLTDCISRILSDINRNDVIQEFLPILDMW